MNPINASLCASASALSAASASASLALEVVSSNALATDLKKLLTAFPFFFVGIGVVFFFRASTIKSSLAC